MLATGDYGGRICVWNIFTGERRCTLTHEAPEYQRGVEQLLFLRPPTPQASPILLSCGGVMIFIVHFPMEKCFSEPDPVHNIEYVPECAKKGCKPVFCSCASHQHHQHSLPLSLPPRPHPSPPSPFPTY